MCDNVAIVTQDSCVWDQVLSSCVHQFTPIVFFSFMAIYSILLLTVLTLQAVSWCVSEVTLEAWCVYHPVSPMWSRLREHPPGKDCALTDDVIFFLQLEAECRVGLLLADIVCVIILIWLDRSYIESQLLKNIIKSIENFEKWNVLSWNELWFFVEFRVLHRAAH